MNKRSLMSVMALLVMLGGTPLALAQSADAGDGTLTATPPATQANPTPTGQGVQLSQDGIFNCRTGRYTMDVGNFFATGGAYVPVADATVELNTGYLVYKACTLDPMIAKIRQGITAGIVAADINAVLYGDRGQPEFVGNLLQYDQQKSNDEELAALQDPSLDAMCSTIKSQTVAVAARQYLQAVNSPGAALACSLNCSDADQQAFLNGDPGAFDRCGGLQAIYQLATNPANTPQGALLGLQKYTGTRTTNRLYQENTYLGWANGFKSPERLIGGVRQVTTPGWLIAQSMAQILGSGYRQLENANSIDQIVGALFSTLSSQILTNHTSGLAGLSQSQNGQPSYVNQVLAQSAQAVRDSAANTALSVLTSTRNAENQYLQLKTLTLGAANDGAARLRGAESQCFVSLIPAVKSYAQTLLCTIDSPGYNGNPGVQTCLTVLPTIKVATSTAFSSVVINARIQPLATSTTQDINTSKQALAVIDQLIGDVSNTSSAAVQSIALQRLDTLVAQNVLHTTIDIRNLQKQTEDIQTALTNMVNDTVAAWGGNENTNSPWDGTISPGVGWCNVNHQATVLAWYNVWTK